MEDGDLAKYISSFGDRLALKSFCRNGTTLQKTKMGLFEKLRVKLKKRNNAEENENENRKTKQARKPEENKKQDAEPADSSAQSAHSSNKGRKASHRKIEIGWLHCEGEQRKQIRSKQGGGTRMVPIGIGCGMDEVLQKGKRLFFPDGLSSKGHESQFNFELRDYKQNPVQEDITELKDDRATDGEKSKCGVITIDEDEADDHQDSHDDSRDDSQQDDPQCDSEQNKSERVQEEEDDVSITGIRYGTLFECALVTDIESEVTIGPGCSEIETDSDNDTEPFDFGFQPQLQLQPPITLDVSSSLHSASSLQQVMDTPPEQLLSTSTVSNDASPAQLPASTSQASLAKIINIHHGNCLNELIKEFMDPTLLTHPLIMRRILPDNSVEKGIGEGVVRDIYCSFWQEFYDRCTVGTAVKVPFIRHDFSCETWKAIARILVSGLQTCQYLPIKLALPLMEDLFHGSVCSNLLESFLQYVSIQDQDILKKALEDFSSVDPDELMEVLENYECQKMVKAETLPQILKEIAHKELVQKPRYVIDCWKEEMHGKVNIAHDDLLARYHALRPNPRRVQGLLDFQEVMTSKQREVENHLRRYLRELDEDHLGKFLRFTTGSDLISCTKIQVVFTKMSDFSRRPIGHTCGFVLEVSDSYDNFPDFRSEFNAVLDSNIWVMDIV
ncbi:hypothetical protein N1851_020117 [Merluccius polli]|uniref:Uncharacterized protein n=1 Tax=Merluccius polli TaxID=89951 RepID=A0AA47MLC5_MERPO|nr:hypothetical protein N1851_020117 [Merluccius polli]